jgi:Type IV secretion system pilin
MKRIKQIIASLLIMTSLGGVSVLMPLPAMSAAGDTPEKLACEGSGGAWNGTACTQGTRTVTGTLKSVGNILIFLVGAIAVLMIIIGGLRYVLSGGDNAGITSAKNTILYAVIGLVVAVAAYAIVNFVLRNV